MSPVFYTMGLGLGLGESGVQAPLLFLEQLKVTDIETGVDKYKAISVLK
jgi:hypothetical protein